MQVQRLQLRLMLHVSAVSRGTPSHQYVRAATHGTAYDWSSLGQSELPIGLRTPGPTQLGGDRLRCRQAARAVAHPRHGCRPSPLPARAMPALLVAGIRSEDDRLGVNARRFDFPASNHRQRRRAGNHPVEQIIDSVVAQVRFAFVANAAPHPHAGEFGGDSLPSCTNHEPPLSIRPAPVSAMPEPIGLALPCPSTVGCVPQSVTAASVVGQGFRPQDRLYPADCHSRWHY